jgi:hypothetical protein
MPKLLRLDAALRACGTVWFVAPSFVPAQLRAQEQTASANPAKEEDGRSPRQSKRRELKGSVGPNVAEDIGDLNQKQAAPNAAPVQVEAPS